jgi:hypothetical protein
LLANRHVDVRKSKKPKGFLLPLNNNAAFIGGDESCIILVSARAQFFRKTRNSFAARNFAHY